MTGEKCRHCGGRIEYVEAVQHPDGGFEAAWWKHVGGPYGGHEAAPAFGGGS